MTPVSVDPLIAIVTFLLLKIYWFYVQVPENTYLNSVYVCVYIYIYMGAWGSVVVKALHYQSDGPGIDPGVTWDFFRGSF